MYCARFSPWLSYSSARRAHSLFRRVDRIPENAIYREQLRARPRRSGGHRRYCDDGVHLFSLEPRGKFLSKLIRCHDVGRAKPQREFGGSTAVCGDDCLCAQVVTSLLLASTSLPLASCHMTAIFGR